MLSFMEDQFGELADSHRKDSCRKGYWMTKRLFQILPRKELCLVSEVKSRLAIYQLV